MSRLNHCCVSRSALVAIGLLFQIFSFSVSANCEQPVATVVSVEGRMEVLRSGTSDWQEIRATHNFCAGDTVKVNVWSRGMFYVDGIQTTVRLNQGTAVTLAEMQRAKGDAKLIVHAGEAFFMARNARNLYVNAPLIDAVVHGTDFFLTIRSKQTTIALLSGSITAKNQYGEATLTKRGEAATAVPGAAPRLELVDSNELVQWSLYYGPVLETLLSAETLGVGEGIRNVFRSKLAALNQGDSAGMYSKSRADMAGNDLAPLLDAAFSLARGEIRMAKAKLSSVSRQSKFYGIGLAIKSIIELRTGYNDSALTLAKAALRYSPDHSLPSLAYALAKRAVGDLDGAIAELKQAVEKDPRNGLLRAQFAELLLSKRLITDARSQADEAARLSGDFALVHRVYGASLMLGLDLRGAVNSFREAVLLDEADPYARYGLGLAYLRLGRSEEGRKQLEIAAALSPTLSIVRSYLALAYFKEGDFELALEELRLASELDPQDPTPLLYKAFIHQARNEPTLALAEINHSIELNDNRAIYRSKFLRNQDLATRTANRAAIYRSIRFTDLAFVDANYAINRSPTDYSGLLLNAQLFSTVPRHEEATITSALQARMSGPLSLDLIQSNMTETTQMLPDGLVPMNAGVREYTRLLDELGFDSRLATVIGSKNTYGAEASSAVTTEDLFLGATQYYLETRASDVDASTSPYRRNQGVSIHLQKQIGPASALLMEVFHNYAESDESSMTYEDTKLALSSRHDWTPEDSTRVYGYTFDGLQKEKEDGFDFIQNTLEGSGFELRHDWSRDQYSAAFGVGYYQFHESIQGFDKQIRGPKKTNSELEVYGYVWKEFGGGVIINFGASMAYLDDENIVRWKDNDPYSHGRVGFGIYPKFGFLYQLDETTAFRATALKMLRRPGQFDTTLQPTNVGGFNQMFDGLFGETFWLYGFGIDHKFPNSLYAGLGLTARNRKSPQLMDLGPNMSYFYSRLRERALSVYLNWVVNNNSAVSTRLIYERDVLVSNTGSRDETLRLPVTVSYHHGDGWRGSVTAQGVRQEANRKVEKFLNVDLDIGYSLPKKGVSFLFSVNNLLDENHAYEETDEEHPLFMAERTVGVRTVFEM